MRTDERGADTDGRGDAAAIEFVAISALDVITKTIETRRRKFVSIAITAALGTASQI